MGIPDAAWLIANHDGGTTAASLTVVNGRIATFTEGSDNSAGAESNWASSEYDGTGSTTAPESLYAITFVENSGDIPMLGARYQWEFNQAVGDIVAEATAGGVVTTVASGDSCVDDNSYTDCRYSQSGPDGLFHGSYKGSTGEVYGVGSNGYSFYVQELFKGDREEAICSNRGLCDYSTGLCKCFNGFTKNDCSVQNSLASA